MKVPLSKKLMLLGEGNEDPKHRGRSVKADQSGGAPGLHKRGTSAEDWGGIRDGRVAPSLDGTGAGSPPNQSESLPSGIYCPSAGFSELQRRRLAAER